jgi:hypothetical protein
VDFFLTTKHSIPEGGTPANDRCANLCPNSFVYDLLNDAVRRSDYLANDEEISVKVFGRKDRGTI